MRILNTFFKEIITQSKTAFSFGIRLIVLRGRRTRNNLIDLSFCPVGVPLERWEYAIVDYYIYIIYDSFPRRKNFPGLEKVIVIRCRPRCLCSKSEG